MGRTVLVTGGSGFIGSYILRFLAERGDTVINFDTRPLSGEAAWRCEPVKEHIRFVQGSIDTWSDVVMAIKMYQPESVIHTATLTNPVLLNQRPSLALSVNVNGAYHVLEAARIFGLQRVIYFSSIGVLPGVQYEPIDVNHPVLLGTEGPGSSFYGASKVAGEAFCWAYRQAFGLDFIILRPSAVYGPGMNWPIYIKPIVEDAVHGRSTRFDHGREFPRDYTHAADVAQLSIKALDVPAEQVQDRVFYGATGQPLVTAGKVAEIVKEFIPTADIEIGSGMSAGDLIEIRYRGVLSIQNAQEQLGYQPRFAHIRDGIADYIEQYRRYLDETKA